MAICKLRTGCRSEVDDIVLGQTVSRGSRRLASENFPTAAVWTLQSLAAALAGAPPKLPAEAPALVPFPYKEEDVALAQQWRQLPSS